MPFSTNLVESVDFTERTDLERYLKTEEQKIEYVPISNYLTNGGQFSMDQFVGRSKDFLEFTEDGFKAFCSQFQISVDFLMKLNQSNLVSQILNDWMNSQDLRSFKFVLDKNSRHILGVVSGTYVPYSNHQFYSDMMYVLGYQFDNYSLTNCYIDNTNFNMRLMGDINAGLIDGRGGKAVDRFTVGIQLSNSMVGERYVQASFFVYRLICANGLVIQTKDDIGRVKHSGSKESFIKRLNEKIIPVFERLETVPNMIHLLGNIPFDIEIFVREGGAKKVYNIMPLPYWERIKRNQKKGTDLHSYDLEKMMEYISQYSGKLSREVFASSWRDNQSMFDFVNIFTEHAKTLRTRERIEVEEKSGDLVQWIINNKDKLLEGNAPDKVYQLGYYSASL